MRRPQRLGILLAAALVLVGCTGARDDDARPSNPTSSPTQSPSAPTTAVPATPTPAWGPAGDPVVAATGLDAPWSVVPLPDGTQLVSQRDTGEVLEVGRDGRSRVIGTIAVASAGGEGGLHGLAVMQTLEGATRVFAYVGTAEDNRVVRMTLAGEAGARIIGAPEVVIDGIPRDRVHNGGRIAFGPDGYLYVATGDASVRDAAQDPASLAGKILRLTSNGDPAPGNPFGTEVYSLGHRNVQGLAWTRDGTLWATEFGQDTFDELNRIQAGGNYGWPVHEGDSDDDAFVDPVVTWTPDEASPSGLAAIDDTLFVAGLRGERVWAVDVSGSSVVGDPRALWAGEFGRIRDAVATEGELWLLTNNTDGRGDAAPDDDRLLRVPLVPLA